ncbi:hypothetical protein Tco_0876146 [Tanacetum coccineum]|uniref:Uncharacterized protein n=1 Tax=Tanacetum coccineum TaxID=301880 RepID=A0ABQ5BRG0_9ASTR
MSMMSLIQKTFEEVPSRLPDTSESIRHNTTLLMLLREPIVVNQDSRYTKEGKKKSELRKASGQDHMEDSICYDDTMTIPLQSHPTIDCNNPTSLEAFKEHSETIIDYNDDSTSSDDDSYENIDYVDASPVPFVIKRPPHFLSFLEETNTFDNSIPESETFRFNLEEISSGSPTTHSELSLPDYKAFYVDNDHFKEKSSGSTTTHVDFSQYDSLSLILLVLSVSSYR